jgi:serine/threonine-protein phosphatase PGAM5
LSARALLSAAVLAASTEVAAQPAPAAKPEARTRTIVLLRHGQYAEKDPAAHPDLGGALTPLGIAQARLTGARLAGRPERFDAVLASPLTRAQETARIVGDDLAVPVEKVDALAECTPPTWRASVVADEKPEDMAACARQLDGLVESRFRPAEGADRQELWVCHGNVIRYLVTKALKVDTKAWLEMSVGHTSLTTLVVAPDGTFRVVAVGDVGHLPPSMLTGATGNPERALTVPAR